MYSICRHFYIVSDLSGVSFCVSVVCRRVSIRAQRLCAFKNLRDAELSLNLVLGSLLKFDSTFNLWLKSGDSNVNFM
jgi:hypothetical protein